VAADGGVDGGGPVVRQRSRARDGVGSEAGAHGDAVSVVGTEPVVGRCPTSGQSRRWWSGAPPRETA
jgi:hypothetical protein